MRRAPFLEVTLLWLSFAACHRGAAESDSPPAAAEPDARQHVENALPAFRNPTGVTTQPDPAALDEAISHVARGQYAAARPHLESILDADAGHGRATFLLAYTHHKEKRYARARPLFERALEIGPTFEKAFGIFYMYAWCLWYLGEPDGAAAAFEAALEFKPDERDAWFGLGLVALEENEIDEAERRFAKAIEIGEQLAAASPDDTRLAAQLKRDRAKAEAGLGDVELRRENYEAARARFETCVSLHPTAYEAWFKLHRIHSRLGDSSKAELALRMHAQAKRALGR